MGVRRCRRSFSLILVGLAMALSGGALAQGPARPGRTRPRDVPQGTVCHVPSEAAGEKGVAVRVLPPRTPRFEEGAPVVIHVAGGIQPGNAAGLPEFVGLGFVEIYFAFPGGGRGEASSGGTYDIRGPRSIRALADVIRFATGRAADRQGRHIDDLAGGIKVLRWNCGLIGSSHGGNACGVVMARHGEEFPDLAFYASMESPYGEGAVSAELGGFETGVNPAYDPETGVLDLGRLAWSADLAPRFFRPVGHPGSDLKGALFFDLDGDGKYAPRRDFAAHVFVCDVGEGVKAYYSPRLVREAERRSLFPGERPGHIPALTECEEFWQHRDAAGSIPEAVRKCPDVAVIVYAGERDHVQAAPDHPHILTQVEGFRRAKARFVRLNPDRCYVERVLEAAGIARLKTGLDFADNDAGVPFDRRNIRGALEPRGVPIGIYMQAAVCELADRVHAKNWSANLEKVLYSDAPWMPLVRPPLARRPGFPGGGQGGPGEGPAGPGQGPRPPGGEAPPRGEPYGQGVKDLQVDSGKVVGRIRSLLGVNRGPIWHLRDRDAPPASLVGSYRRFGVDFIRTHDFYGPTDWYVIFPDWKADPEDPSSYDFRSSDVKIKAIVENGFRCFYRLGTSWKGRERRPINDPPGTIRNAEGKVVHHAGRDDFRKWAKICLQTVRHYTEGWKDGFRYPIEYWEIWNEPDLRAQFWTGTAEQYCILYEEAAKAIKAANPKLKVGGPACTGGLREAYVEGFLRYCRDHQVPLDFFSWHSYGGRVGINPYGFYRDAVRIRKALDEHGFEETENILSEWNAGIGPRLFSGTPAGGAFYASTLAGLLDAGVDHAFQYCGDRHPGLGLHDFETSAPKICAFAFLAWKRLLETPERIETRGGDDRGYSILAGKTRDGRRVQILLSDFQSGHDTFQIRVVNLPWDAKMPVKVKRWLLDAEHRMDPVEETTLHGPELTLKRPLRSPAVCLIELTAGE